MSWKHIFGEQRSRGGRVLAGGPSPSEHLPKFDSNIIMDAQPPDSNDYNKERDGGGGGGGDDEDEDESYEDNNRRKGGESKKRSQQKKGMRKTTTTINKNKKDQFRSAKPRCASF
eukprot:GEZU01010125.1.p1 GENE.GEZU01010125.1~~GEZU01010125.1.p1  ORF type:complete len:115 (+),score=19.84 GEZU01010125.1:237-581(+)